MTSKSVCPLLLYVAMMMSLLKKPVVGTTHRRSSRDRRNIGLSSAVSPRALMMTPLPLKLGKPQAIGLGVIFCPSGSRIGAALVGNISPVWILAAPNRACTSTTIWAISLDCSGAKLYLPHMLLTPFEDEGRTALIY